MKNSAFFPVERNRYFYGKLLSVDDFELEQKYMNDKRRLANRLTVGTGIVTGMYVMAVDERTISVETGYAIDALGREVVMDSPVIKKLSLIDGFDTCMEAQNHYAYLCAEYREEGTSPVYNIAGNGSGHPEHGDQGEYSRIREGCHLYLTGQEPEDSNLSFDGLFQRCVTVYSGNGVTIRQIMPGFTQEGQELQLQLEIENLNQRYISFSYDLELTCLLFEDKQTLTVSFDEMLCEKTGNYRLSYDLRAAQTTDVQGTAALVPGSFRLYMEKQLLEARAEGKSETRLTARDPKEEMLDHFYRTPMEKTLQNGRNEMIYLAKIYMIKAGDSYMIHNVVPVPFGQYVVNSTLSAALSRMMMRELIEMKHCHREKGDGEPYTAGREGSGIQSESGNCEFSLDKGGQKGQRLFSTEIFHGLGLGPITVILGVKEQSVSYFGSARVFEAQQVKVETAVCVDEEKGCFTVGVRFLEAVSSGKLTVNWTAFRRLEEEHRESFEKKIFIRPGMLELEVRESHHLEAVCVNMTEKQVLWSCREGEGFMDENGYYTAPNRAGVYEITAVSAAFPNVRASVYAVVREQEGAYGN